MSNATLSQVEPADYPQGWYHVYVEYAQGHKPACVDLEKLASILPHGSGIDGNYHISVRRNGDISVSGEYHQMDEWGGYNGWKTFKFTIKRATKNEYQALRGPCEGQWQVTRKTGTVYLTSFMGGGNANRDYLYDCVSIALSDDMGVRAITSDVVNSEQAARDLR